MWVKELEKDCTPLNLNVSRHHKIHSYTALFLSNLRGEICLINPVAFSTGICVGVLMMFLMSTDSPSEGCAGFPRGPGPRHSPVTAVHSAKNTFLPTFEPKPTTSRTPISSLTHPLYGMSRTPQDVYASNLLRRQSFGYPLRNPRPKDKYSEEGFRIGDVGHVDENGEFNVLFNISSPPKALQDPLVAPGFDLAQSPAKSAFDAGKIFMAGVERRRQAESEQR